MILSSGDTVLVHYDPNAETRVLSDASLYSLGAVLEQQEKDKTWQPVVKISITLCATIYTDREGSPCHYVGL